MRETHFVAQAVPGVSNVLAMTARHAHDNGCGKSIRRAPPQRSTIVQLFGGRIGVFAKLDFRHRHEASDGHADGAADDSLLGEARVEYPPVAELSLEAFGDQMYAAFAADVFTEDEHFRIHLQLVPQRTSHGVRESNNLTLFARFLGSAEGLPLAGRQPANGGGRIGLLEDESPNELRIGRGPRSRLAQAFVDVALHLSLELAPLGDG